MATVTVVDRETFRKVVRQLEDNTDFFDPLMLSPEMYPGPLTKEDAKTMFSDTNIDPNEGWMVVYFLQFYSDVDLMGHAKAPKRSESMRRHENTEMWYAMYIGDALGAGDLF